MIGFTDWNDTDRDGENSDSDWSDNHSINNDDEDIINSESDHVSSTSDASTASDVDDDDLKLNDNDISIIYDGWRKAVESGNETLASFYFEEYPSINMLDYTWNDGDTALHIACKNKKIRLVFLLLTKGAIVNAQNTQNNDTPLHHAVHKHDEKIISLLLQYNADPYVMNKNNETAITISSKFRDKSIFDSLSINNKLNRLKSNSDIFTALSIASESMNSMHSIPEANIISRDLTLELKIEKIKDVNPFVLGPRNAAKTKEIISKKFNYDELPKLQAWLEKKKPHSVRNTYQKRWVMVKGAHILWSEKLRFIKDDKNRKERKKFNGSIHLNSIDKISEIKTKSNNKFMVKAKNPKAKKKGNLENIYLNVQVPSIEIIGSTD
eukprot:2909_1